ncbi:MAG: glycosyltransferase family 2 protein [Oscillospiraceae bacterium]|nr:glycosyltransferase family 2 protein [Oscillospiraceae bacterium]
MPQNDEKAYDLTLVLPCRNEADAVGACIEEARGFLEKNGLRGELLLVDNGSTDGSAQEAEARGARVIHEPEPGYGNALRAGIAAARADVILMGDCDTTYDFAQLGLLYEPLAAGRCDVMIGNRFAGGIEPGAMPLSHKLGVKALSALARLRFKSDVYDFHCGLRGLTRAAAEKMQLRASGMEFATELIAEASRKGLRVGQAPVRLRRCTAKRSPKLRTIRDGFRHLGCILRRL